MYPLEKKALGQELTKDLLMSFILLKSGFEPGVGKTSCTGKENRISHPSASDTLVQITSVHVCYLNRSKNIGVSDHGSFVFCLIVPTAQNECSTKNQTELSTPYRSVKSHIIFSLIFEHTELPYTEGQTTQLSLNFKSLSQTKSRSVLAALNTSSFSEF